MSMNQRKLQLYFILGTYLIINSLALFFTMYSNVTCDYMRITLTRKLNTTEISEQLDKTTTNNITNNTRQNATGDYGYGISTAKFDVNQGLWKGQVDGWKVHEICTSYSHNDFDKKWTAARVFSVISNILALSIYIMTIELFKLEYDRKRKCLIRFTLVELIIAQGLTFMSISSNMCEYVGVPG